MFDPTQIGGVLRGADLENIQESGHSLEEPVTNYFQYGVPSALLSGGIGIYNTFTALGNSAGLTLDYVDESKVIGDVLGQDAKQFYANHKLGVDVAGMLAGSFAAGLGAVKALRLAQASGSMRLGITAATGLESGDIVLGSEAVAAAKQAALINPFSFSLNNVHMYTALATGARQQVAEALLFDVAATATNNQNVMLNPDHEGYFTAFGHQFAETVPFTAIGAGIGTAFEGLKIVGAVNKAREAKMLEAAPYTQIARDLPTWATDGDKLTEAVALRNAMQAEATVTDPFIAGHKTAALNQLDTYIKSSIISMNKAGDAGLALLSKIVGDTSLTKAQIAEQLAGATALRPFSLKEADHLRAWYGGTNAPTAVIEGDNTNQALTSLGKFYQALNPEIDSKVLGEIIAKTKAHLVPQGKGTAGWALGRSQNMAAGDIAGFPAFRHFGTSGRGSLMGLIYTTTNKDILASFKSGLLYAAEAAPDNPFSAKLAALSDEDVRSLVFLHELGHYKSNSSPALDMVTRWGIKQNSAMKELEQFSRKFFPHEWNAIDSLEKQVPGYKSGMYSGNVEMQYVAKPAELMANAASLFYHPAFAEMAAKAAPKVAKIFETFGGIAKPFKAQKLAVNVRTGEFFGSVLPLPQDLGKVTMVNGAIRVAGQQVGYTYDTRMFDPKVVRETWGDIAKIGKGVESAAYMHAAAMYAAAMQETAANYFVRAENAYKFAEFDLPRIENFLTQVKTGALKLDANAGIKVGNSSQSLTTLQDYLLQSKFNMRQTLAGEFTFNEWEIAHGLNMDLKAAQGFTGYTDGMILGNARNYSMPEHIVMLSTKLSPADIKVSVKSEAALQYRLAIQNEVAARASSYVLGTDGELLPKISRKDALVLSDTEGQAGLLKAQKSRVGANQLREKASYVQRIVHKIIGSEGSKIESDYGAHYQIFNKPENVQLRAELVLATNKLYSDWYTLERLTGLGDFQITLESKAQAQKLANDAIETLKSGGVPKIAPFDTGAALDFDNYYKGAVKQLVASGAPGVHSLSKEVADFFALRLRRNSDTVLKHGQLAQAMGYTNTWRSDVLYPPPRNLTRNPHVAFVIPIGEASPEQGRFMLYGTTAQDLQGKMQQAQETFGQTHRVVTGKEVELHKKLIGEYDKGDVFSDWEFDPSLLRKHRAADAVPNLDLNSSEILDRFRNWEHRILRKQVRQAVELKYQDVVQGLRSAAEELGKAQTANIFNVKGKANIWQDTLDMLLDKASSGDQAVEGWKRINGFVASTATKALDSVVNHFGTIPAAKFTQKDLDEMNLAMESKGFNPPFKDVIRAVAYSPDAANSRSFEALVRTANNLAGTFQLTLDVMNSIVQTISTPIMTLPVIREALRNSAEVHNLLHVANPVLGTAEPTPMKIFFNAVRALWSPEGKQFMQEARDRTILSDYMREYVEAQDFSTLTGRHSITALNDKVNKLREFGGKWTGWRFAEDFSRFVAAHSIKQVCELRGMAPEEMWSVISNGVESVHGVYRAHGRAQLFNGVIGQGIGLFQTYMFNWMHQATRYITDGQQRNALIMGAMQSTVFGVRSLPGFDHFNNMIAATNTGNLDLYQATSADDPKSWGAWLMYGLGSHALGYPVDLFSRGDMAIRNSLIVPSPFDVSSWPSVSIISKFIANGVNTAELISNGASVRDALSFGLAHNGLNRPLQGLGNILVGSLTTGQGAPLLANINYNDYDTSEGINYAGMFARLVGSKPLAESIMLDDFYRKKAFKAADLEASKEVGNAIKLTLLSGNTPTQAQYAEFAQEYEERGGTLEAFNRFWSTEMAAASKPQVKSLHDQLAQDGPLARLKARLMVERQAVQFGE